MRVRIGKKGFEMTTSFMIGLIMLLIVLFIIIMSFRYTQGGFSTAIERLRNIF